jgi:hypothetical protein
MPKAVGLSRQEKIMTFLVAHRVTGFPMLHGHAMPRARRQLTTKLRGWRLPTPQERATRYVSRMPIAVLAPQKGGPGGKGD